MITNLVQSLLLKQEFIPEHTNTRFQPGQVFQGKVMKLFPNQIAEVQVGNQRLIAKLEVPLSAGAKYWFQVLPGEGKVHLKVMPMDDNHHQHSLTGIMKQLQLPATRENLELMNFFIKEQLPVSKESLQAARNLLGSTNYSKEDFAALKEILIRNLPATKDVFLSLFSNYKNESYQPVIQKLQAQLEQSPASTTKQHLLSLLNELVLTGQEKGEVKADGASKWESGKLFADHIRGLVEKLGLDYENRLLSSYKEGNPFDGHKLDSVKAVLLKFMSEEPQGPLKEATEQLFHKITGQQLLSQEQGPTQQHVLQVPLSFWNKTTDLTIQWNGRKKENGQIDPDYCRVLFYLDLDHLNEVIVDLQIQNRIMNIRIINDVPEIKTISAPFLEGLKENLEQLGFKLSKIDFQRTSEQKGKDNHKVHKQYYQTSLYNGVDFRV